LNSYKTLLQSNSSHTLKIKKSKFIGIAHPVISEAEIKKVLERIKAEHPKATHWCYAYKIGLNNERIKYSDDGEPNNSAGKPILGQLLNFNLTNVLVVVVRYYGGTKLGVGGLMSAYKEAAFEVLKHSNIVQKEITCVMALKFKYKLLNEVMRIAKQYNLHFLEQQLEMECMIKFSVPRELLSTIAEEFERYYEISFEVLND